MRREERQHLKENPLAEWIGGIGGVARQSGGVLAIALVVLGVVLIAGAGYFIWQSRQTEQAGELLARAMTVLEAQVVPPPDDADGSDVAFTQPPGTYATIEEKLAEGLPQLLEAANAYPETEAGITARYHAAAVLVSLGRAEEAIEHYERVIELDADELYGTMAVLGLAEANVAAGHYDAAIALLEEEAGAPETPVPVDAVLMRLGRAYQRAGRSDDALAAFTRITEEFPSSVYQADAREAIDALQSAPAGA